jgi:signal transduction histidine kinase
VLTFFGTDGDRVLLLIIFVMLWLACASALEFGGLAQRTTGWTRLRAIVWGALALTLGIMVAQTLAALPVLLGGHVQLQNKLIFSLGGGSAIFFGSAYAFYLMSRPGLTVACILKASLSLTVGQVGVSLLVLYYIMPLQMIRLDWGLMIASAMMGLATTTGTFALTATALNQVNRLFAAALLAIGLAGSRFLTIIGTSGLPLTEAISESDRVPIFSLGLHATPVVVMIGIVVIVAVLVGLMALMLITRPWRANRDQLRTRRAHDLRRQVQEAEIQRLTLEDRLADMTRQRDLAVADRARALGSAQAVQASLNQEMARRRQILDEHRQLLDRQAHQHGNFITTTVHETRHLVQTILGDTTRVLDPIRSDLSPEQRRLLTRMGDTTDQLLGLLCTLSDFGRLQGPAPALPLRALPLADLIGRLRTTLDPVAQYAGLTIEWPKDAMLTGRAVQTDGERLYQVLAELIRNGLRFNRPGGTVSIAVDYLPAPDGSPDGARLRLVVADTGVGIGPDLAPDLFSPFARRPAAMPLGPSLGAGLGLAIAQRLAQSLKSSIVFASEPGIGSRFWLDITALETVAATASAPVSPAAAERAYPQDFALSVAQ